MGDIIRPDRAISNDIMLKLMDCVEKDWESLNGVNTLKLALKRCFYTLAFTLAFRRQEVPTITGLMASTIQYLM